MKSSGHYISLAVFTLAFSAAAFLMFSFPAFQWVEMDSYIWPAALALWVIAVIALLFPMTPYGKRSLANRNKLSVGLSCVILLLYALVGLVTMLLYPLRMASGV